ncbi:apolipoprotein D-like, partial [Pollicipes pollicipes]|uniref:apolipoprotein D-like n=1 Tax=Pollicipes pollicipes TaxID=41117 RepID=UPI0018856D00
YSGQWYETARYRQRDDSGYTRGRASYTLPSDDAGFLRCSNVAKWTNSSLYRTSVTARADNPAHPADITVRSGWTVIRKYKIVRTDYVQSALIHTCHSVLAVLGVEYAWVLSRTPQLDKSVVDEDIQVLADTGSNTSLLSMTSQDCGSFF